MRRILNWLSHGPSPQNDPIVDRTKRPFWLQILSVLVLLLSFGYIILLVVLTSIRMLYPYELEWIEGGIIDQIRWIANGNSIYGEPSISFIPAAYNPLYFVICAGLMKVVGGGFIPARCVSIVATIGCFILLFLVVYRISRDYLPGLAAAGIYAASFRFSGAWMDLAKTDSLFIFLILLAFFIGQRFKGYGGIILSGLTFVLAYYTKQVALPIILVTASFSLLASRGRTWMQWAIAFLVGIIVFAWLEISTDGWYSFYTLDNFLRHKRVYDLSIFWVPLLRNMWPVILLSLLYPILSIRTQRFKNLLQDNEFLPHLGFGLALIIASWSVFTKIWTYENGFMPAVAGLAITAGLGYDQLVKKIRRISPTGRSNFFETAGLILLIFQFVFFYYSPIDQLPTQQDREAKANFVQWLTEIEGETFVFHHGYFNYLAGKNSYLHSSFYGDVVGGNDPARTEENAWRYEMAKRTFDNAISQQEFEWIIVGEKIVQQFFPYYIESSKAPVQFYPATGAPGQREVFLRRNSNALGDNLSIPDSVMDGQLSDALGIPEDDRRITAGVTSTSVEQEEE